MESPPCAWKAAMSRLVMRSTTRTARVTKVIWSCSSPRNLMTFGDTGRWRVRRGVSLGVSPGGGGGGAHLEQRLHHAAGDQGLAAGIVAGQVVEEGEEGGGELVGVGLQRGVCAGDSAVT